MLPIIKYYMRLNSLKKIKFLCKSKKTTAIGKSLVKNQIKNKIFFCTVSKFQKTSAMEQNRFIQRNKKNIPRRDILRILVAVISRFNVKDCPLSLKFHHLFICISLK